VYELDVLKNFDLVSNEFQSYFSMIMNWSLFRLSRCFLIFSFESMVLRLFDVFAVW
jgi:hypothetical protein